MASHIATGVSLRASRTLPVSNNSTDVSRTSSQPSRSTSKTATTTPEGSPGAVIRTTGAKMPGTDGSNFSLTPDLAYTNAAAIFARAETVDRLVDCLIVGGVSAADFRQVEAERDRLASRIRLFFLPDQACAIVTIPTFPHEIAHDRLSNLVYRSLFQMGMDNEWRGVQSTTFSARGGSGEGDSGGGPRWRTDCDELYWPTLVIESGFTQSMESLRAKANWWFAASDNHMKIVVLVKMTLTITQSSIAVEKWTAAARHTGRPGVTTTRSFAHAIPRIMVPSCQHRVDISWSSTTPLQQIPRRNRVPALFSVAGAPMVLGFEELMLRPPVPAHGEQDIVISEADLQDLASRVWECV